MAWGILVPQPGIKPMSPALEGGSLTIEPPEKPLFCVFILVVIAAQNCTLFYLYSEEFIKRKVDIPQNYHKSQGTYDLLMCVCTSSDKGFSSLSRGEEPVTVTFPLREVPFTYHAELTGYHVSLMFPFSFHSLPPPLCPILSGQACPWNLSGLGQKYKFESILLCLNM